MKKTFFAIIILMNFFSSCKKETKVTKVTPLIPKQVTIERPDSKECYMGALKKDTFSVTLNIKGNGLVTGELNYKFHEKDLNIGTLSGRIKRDTLLADYTFMSEGISSVRQVVFLKKINTLVEAYGDRIDDNNGKVIFTDIKKLKFDGPVLLKVDCKE